MYRLKASSHSKSVISIIAGDVWASCSFKTFSVTSQESLCTQVTQETYKKSDLVAFAFKPLGFSVISRVLKCIDIQLKKLYQTSKK